MQFIVLSTDELLAGCIFFTEQCKVDSIPPSGLSYPSTQMREEHRKVNAIQAKNRILKTACIQWLKTTR